jgi:hypothetical protein
MAKVASFFPASSNTHCSLPVLILTRDAVWRLQSTSLDGARFPFLSPREY